MKQSLKNKLSTPAYICHRLRRSGFDVVKVFSNFSEGDPRKWTILVNPGDASLFITCYENKEYEGHILFELHDGGRRWPKNYHISTLSVEVIMNELIERRVPNNKPIK